MKNVFVAMAVTLGLMACGSPNGIDMKPDTSGSGGASSGSMGNGSGGDAGTLTCDCPTGDGARLTRQYVVGDDGSRMESFVWYDKQLDLKCSFQSLPNGQTYCVPPHDAVSHAPYFDVNCTKPVYRRIVYKNDNLDCPDLPTHVRYGQAIGGACNTPATVNYVFYRVTDKLIARTNAWYEVDDMGNCVMHNVNNLPTQEVALWETVKIAPLELFVKAVEGLGF